MEVQKMSNSSTTTEADLIQPIHPGEILMEDFIEGFGITQNKLAVSIGVPPRRINEIVHGKRGITADTAIRLARYFGTSEELWMNLQSNYELRLALLRRLLATPSIGEVVGVDVSARELEIAAASTGSMHLSIDATATRTADEVADALTARLGARRGPSR